jgi:hypothetical protein
VGRPKVKWLEDAENYLREYKMKMWRQEENNKEEYGSAIKEGRVRRRP